MPHDDDRSTEIFRDVYERMDSSASEAPEWSAIPKPGFDRAHPWWKGPSIALATAAAVILLIGIVAIAAPRLAQENAPASAPTEGPIVAIYLADDISSDQRQDLIETLTAQPGVIDWRYVSKSQAHEEALAAYADSESYLRLLTDHPELVWASIRLLAGTETEATAIKVPTVTDPPTNGVIGIGRYHGTLSSTYPIGIGTPADLYEAYIATLPIETGFVCPVTIPPQPGFSPPDEYPATPAFGVWYGTEDLWTVLDTDGTYRPRKTVLWSVNYAGGTEGQRPAVDATWTRLDTPGASLSNDGLATTGGYTQEDGWFMIAGLDPNTPGCWEVTASYMGATLSYVYLAP